MILVDDEPAVLMTLEAIFAGEPWEVVACASGEAAVEAMGRGVDVLLTDKNLGDINGLELIRRARVIQPDVMPLILTGYASLDTALEAMHLEVFDYLLKPPRDIFDVQRKVRQAFERQAMQRENAALLVRLTEQNRQLERAIQEQRALQAELIQSEKLAGIGTLAAGIAHEVSSPLFGVMGLAEAILDEDDQALVRGYAREIVDYSRSIKEIVQELTRYSRSRGSDGMELVDLARVVEDGVRLVGLATKVPTGAITVEAQGPLPTRGHPNELQQVVVNLVKNAVEAAGDGLSPAPAVQVRAWADASWVWFAVRDNGEGIPEANLDQLFDPFFTTKAPGRGTGLGLNIVYRILTKHQGSVTVHSRLGEGTLFEVRLPREAAAP
ncbi:MAG: hybrid sensor histidine kinase/response regulator [Deltaproteobacteria bacterium]|nr:hybrid sensor histidine kinase/response regulator [Deltaproteobacteria bacterium]